jgi:hypothetical protein
MRSSVCLTHVRRRAGRTRSADLSERRHGGGERRDGNSQADSSRYISWGSFAAHAAG